MGKYLFDDNGFVYELDSNEYYNPIAYLSHHNLPPYAKVKLACMQEHQPEYVLALLNEGKLFEFLTNYNKAQVEAENRIYDKAVIKDSMTRMMAREWLMYQDLT